MTLSVIYLTLGLNCLRWGVRSGEHSAGEAMQAENKDNKSSLVAASASLPSLKARRSVSGRSSLMAASPALACRVYPRSAMSARTTGTGILPRTCILPSSVASLVQRYRWEREGTLLGAVLLDVLPRHGLARGQIRNFTPLFLTESESGRDVTRDDSRCFCSAFSN
jgi:hypothetical protein